MKEAGECHVLVPITMLKEHVDSEEIRDTEVWLPANAVQGITQPAPSASLTDAAAKALAETLLGNNQHVANIEEPDDQLERNDQLEASPQIDEDELDNYELTSQDIEFICASVFESEEANSGRTPLQRGGLDDAPHPWDIIDHY